MSHELKRVSIALTAGQLEYLRARVNVSAYVRLLVDADMRKNGVGRPSGTGRGPGRPGPGRPKKRRDASPAGTRWIPLCYAAMSDYTGERPLQEVMGEVGHPGFGAPLARLGDAESERVCRALVTAIDDEEGRV